MLNAPVPPLPKARGKDSYVMYVYVHLQVRVMLVQACGGGQKSMFSIPIFRGETNHPSTQP